MTKSIDALARGVMVIEEMHRRGAVTLSDLHRSTDINKATLLRILRTLVEAGWVIRLSEQRGYRLLNDMSLRLNLAELSRRLRCAGAPILADLSREYEAWAELWVPGDNGLCRICSVLPNSSDNCSDLENSTIPWLSSAPGLAYIACCGDEERDRVFKEIISQGGRDATLLKRDRAWFSNTIERLKLQGFIHHTPLTSSPGRMGMETVAAPITTPHSMPVVLSISWPGRTSANNNPGIKAIPRVKQAAKSISTALSKN